MKTARTAKTFLLLLSLGLLMCLPFSEGSAFASDAMKANTARMEQGDFLAGPGIAVAETESGRVQGYVRKGVYTPITAFPTPRQRSVSSAPNA